MKIPTDTLETLTTDAAPDHRWGRLPTAALAGAVMLALAGGYGVTTAQAAAAPALQPNTPAATIRPPSFADIAQRVTPAVVNVAVDQEIDSGPAGPSFQMPELPQGSPFGDLFRRFFDQQGGQGRSAPRHVRALGSGFIIDPAGYIVTNNHVVDGASKVQVILNDGTRYPATIVGRDPKTDLALLKVDAPKPLPYVKFGDSGSARVGEWVLAVGNPFGLGGSVTAGIVSARGRDIHSGPFDDYLQIDAPINRGNSGGPLFDASGKVIGVNTAIFSPSGGNVGIGFAIPAAQARTVIDQLRLHGHIDRGWLGVQIQPVTEAIANGLGLKTARGALVASVVPDSPAARAGLRAGDVILKVGGKAVDDFKALPRIIAAARAGSHLKIEVYRQGATKRLSAVIGKMPGEDEVAAVSGGTRHTGHTRSKLGLYLAPLTPQVRQSQGLADGAQGVVVARVEEGSPAQRAGIEPGSVISMVGQHPVKAPGDVAAAVRKAAQEKRSYVLLRVEQDGEQRFVAVPLAA